VGGKTKMAGWGDQARYARIMRLYLAVNRELSTVNHLLAPH
jgi:hypothetical protein